eukprot:TRINITY_DN121154_c0_g1_i1.p1 TRINITY_DN121154_c0_g1~~TRINITY_DN121154_c0_g1_i1.p1  ORF type:complete len:538 (-),score=47.60 TRINITY_DN121154_c0_g1_i1:192-1805(-)
MIEYDPGTWGVGFILSLHGSVFPRALAWALPAAVVAAAYAEMFRRQWGLPEDYPDIGGTSFTIVWGGFTFIVGFLLVFRTQIAFARFWEGAKILWDVKAVWLNAVSNLISFTTQEPMRKHDADAFQHLLVRLMSLMMGSSLEAIATLDKDYWTSLGVDGIDEEHMEYLAGAHDKVEVIMNWVQRLIVQNYYDGVLAIPAPILSRVFQELSNGMREFQGARRIQEYPFPFPYAQACTVFLILNWALLPLIASLFIPNALAAAVLTFCSTFALWSINYIAAQLEMPFGDDLNDLPVADMQKEFNKSLHMLMHPMTRTPPTFRYLSSKHALFSRSPTRTMREVVASVAQGNPGAMTPKRRQVSFQDEADTKIPEVTVYSSEEAEPASPESRAIPEETRLERLEPVGRLPSQRTGYYNSSFDPCGRDLASSSHSAGSDAVKLQESPGTGSTRCDETKCREDPVRYSNGHNGRYRPTAKTSEGDLGRIRCNHIALNGCRTYAVPAKEAALVSAMEDAARACCSTSLHAPASCNSCNLQESPL